MGEERAPRIWPCCSAVAAAVALVAPVAAVVAHALALAAAGRVGARGGSSHAVCSLDQGCLQAWQLCVPDLVHCQVQQGVAMGPGQHALADAVDHLRAGRQPVSGCGRVGVLVGKFVGLTCDSDVYLSCW